MADNSLRRRPKSQGLLRNRPHLRRLAQPPREIARRQVGERPAPRAALRPRQVHARLAAEAEHVLRLHHRQPRGGGERQADQRPPRLVLAHARLVDAAVDQRAPLGRQRLVPAAHRVVVVGAAVGDALPRRGSTGCGRCPCRRGRSRTGSRPSPAARGRRAARSTAGVITPRSSAISGSSRSSVRAACVEHRAPRPALPAPGQRVLRARRHRPVGDEAAEVVDARDVEQRERAPQPVDPPAVAAALHRRPVVERVAPQLALVGVGVGRRARHRAGLEQLRMRAVVGAARARRRSGRRR